MNTYKKILLLLCVLSIIGLGTLFLPENTEAAGLMVFGGRSTIISFCTGGVLIQVGPPKPGTYLYLAGVSKLYMWHAIYQSGVWVLGNATPGGVCNVPGSPATIPAQGTIRNVGTSLR